MDFTDDFGAFLQRRYPAPQQQNVSTLSPSSSPMAGGYKPFVSKDDNVVRSLIPGYLEDGPHASFQMLVALQFCAEFEGKHDKFVSECKNNTNEMKQKFDSWCKVFDKLVSQLSQTERPGLAPLGHSLRGLDFKCGDFSLLVSARSIEVLNLYDLANLYITFTQDLLSFNQNGSITRRQKDPEAVTCFFQMFYVNVYDSQASGRMEFRSEVAYNEQKTDEDKSVKNSCCINPSHLNHRFAYRGARILFDNAGPYDPHAKAMEPKPFLWYALSEISFEHDDEYEEVATSDKNTAPDVCHHPFLCELNEKDAWKKDRKKVLGNKFVSHICARPSHLALGFGRVNKQHESIANVIMSSGIEPWSLDAETRATKVTDLQEAKDFVYGQKIQYYQRILDDPRSKLSEEENARYKIHKYRSKKNFKELLRYRLSKEENEAI